MYEVVWDALNYGGNDGATQLQLWGQGWNGVEQGGPMSPIDPLVLMLLEPYPSCSHGACCLLLH